MKQTFYSNGKLLITGEYVVLDGAKAFALPTKFGQNLIIEETEGQIIHWKSVDSDGSIWFEDTIPFLSIVRKERFDDAKNIKNTLIEILHEAYLMNTDFITSSKGYTIRTELTFPKFWGLGTSSTLINNIAQWLEIDAFELLKRSFGGSGYDIACAQNNSPILYQLINEKPVVNKVNFKPDFTDKIFFVYLNKKQNSKSAIASYYGQQGNFQNALETIDVFEPQDWAHLHAQAGLLYARCRWHGLTMRNPIDCVVAACALEAELPLLARDADFVHLQRVAPQLQLV